MDRNPHWLALRFLRLSLLGVAAVYLALYLGIALCRMAYPYELEWMEGGVADHVLRLLEGKPLYVAPSLEFTPFIYAPFYYYCCAPIVRLLGGGLFPLRLVSFAASLGCFALIFAFVRREARSAAPAFLAACAFCATYRLSGYWFDLARVDSLFLALLLGGVYALRSRPAPATQLLAAILFFLSFFTKQSALLIALPLVFHALVFLPWRLKFIFPGTFLGLAALATFLYNRASGGWFNFYVFDLPGLHKIVWPALLGFWTEDILTPLAPACLLALLFFIGCFRQGGIPEAAFHLLLAGGLVCGAWFSRIHSGGYYNVVMPAYAALSIYFGLGAAAVLPALLPSAVPSPLPPDRLPAKWTLRLEYGVALACLLHFTLLAYPIAPQVPDPADRRAGDDFIRQLRAIPGEVFLPSHGYLPRLAGKAPHAHSMALLDVFRSTKWPLNIKLHRELCAALAARRFSAVVIDDDLWPSAELRGHYVLKRPVFTEPASFFTFTGVHLRPQMIYEPAR